MFTFLFLLIGFTIKSLFCPLVEKYGYDPKKGESDDDKQLRTLAVAEAAAANDPG